MTKGEEIDDLIKQGLKNRYIIAKGYSLSTIKYRRARIENKLAYKNIIKRCVVNNRIYRRKVLKVGGFMNSEVH